MGRWGRVAVVGVVAAVVIGGGVVLAGRGDDDAGSSAAPTVTTGMDHMHAPGEDGMTEPIVAALTCDPGFDAGGTTATVPADPDGPASPDQATAEGPPSATCLETGTGCVVSFSMGWSDGYVEGASRSVDAPGTYTMAGGRGAEAAFTVDADLICTAPAITYHPTWSASPP